MAKARKKKSTDSAPSTQGSPRRRGPPTHVWDQVQPEEIRAFKEKHALSDRRLGEILGGVSISTVRNWLGGRNAPSSDAQALIRAALDAPGLPPVPPKVPPARRGRSRKSPPAATAIDAATVSAPEVPGPPPVTPAQAVLELATAYLRTPGGQHLTPDQLKALLADLASLLARSS